MPASGSRWSHEPARTDRPHSGARPHHITARVADLVDTPGGDCGLVHIFIHHTSASLIIQENADPDVRRDLDAFFARLVPDGDPLFTHIDEGPDDMSAHVRAVLTATHLTVPMRAGKLALGTWQGIYLWSTARTPTPDESRSPWWVKVA